MSREQITNLIEQLSNIFKLPNFKLDNNGFCSLTFDGKIVLNFDYFEKDNILFIYTPLGKPVEKKIIECYEEVLMANLFWQYTNGATIALEKDNKNLIIFNKIDLIDIDINILIAIMEEFINCAEEWYNYINYDIKIDRFIEQKEASPENINNISI